jgi:hypothetical protein
MITRIRSEPIAQNGGVVHPAGLGLNAICGQLAD